MGKQHLGVERESEDFEEACERQDPRRSDLGHKQDVSTLRTANTKAAIADATVTIREESRKEMVKRVTRLVPDQGPRMSGRGSGNNQLMYPCFILPDIDFFLGLQP